MREYECDKPFLPGANFTWLYFGSAATATATATAPTLTTTNTAIKTFLKRFLMIDCLQHKDVCLLAWVESDVVICGRPVLEDADASVLSIHRLAAAAAEVVQLE